MSRSGSRSSVGTRGKLSFHRRMACDRKLSRYSEAVACRYVLASPAESLMPFYSPWATAPRRDRRTGAVPIRSVATASCRHPRLSRAPLVQGARMAMAADFDHPSNIVELRLTGPSQSPTDGRQRLTSREALLPSFPSSAWERNRPKLQLRYNKATADGNQNKEP